MEGTDNGSSDNEGSTVIVTQQLFLKLQIRFILINDETSLLRRFIYMHLKDAILRY